MTVEQREWTPILETVSDGSVEVTVENALCTRIYTTSRSSHGFVSVRDEAPIALSLRCVTDAPTNCLIRFTVPVGPIIEAVGRVDGAGASWLFLSRIDEKWLQIGARLPAGVTRLAAVGLCTLNAEGGVGAGVEGRATPVSEKPRSR